MANAKDIRDLCLYRWRSYIHVWGAGGSVHVRVCVRMRIRKWAKGKTSPGVDRVFRRALECVHVCASPCPSPQLPPYLSSVFLRLIAMGKCWRRTVKT